ncbi:hypothetical protein [Flavobacterium selenitireducens]|uniref:hypothetical protein n=1 Tax=Flavobacterium selenitireducens TaxID=2722704 RepID=UPI00168B338F|nr:hypothetical protein [Flavobacterium selenitireducens]MBD3583705.1 hypothetical protein [Flavobacterium selenitireducens]
MKTTCFTILFTLFALSSNAQVSVNVNVGSPPAWAPATPARTEYYYLPDIDSYYDIRTTEYIYVTKGKWIRSRSLPVAHRTYNPYKGRTIIINDYHGRSPYVNYRTHKVKYKGGKHAVVKGKHRGHGKGHAKGHGKGHDKH